MRLREYIRKVARRLTHAHTEYVCDHAGRTPVCRTVLRSVAAVLAGWLVTFGGCVVTIVVIALLHPEVFQPAAHHSVGYWLINLSVGLFSSVVGGFVTGIIARRREIAHAIGLVVFTLFISTCWPRGHAKATSVPNWYWIAGYVLMPSSTVLGGWLRARQHTLVRRIPGGVVQTVDDLRFSMALTVDFFRFPIAVVVSIVTFVTGFYAGVLSGGAVLLAMRKFLGEEPQGDIAAMFISLTVGASLLLAFLLSRYLYRKIMLRDASFLPGRKQG